LERLEYKVPVFGVGPVKRDMLLCLRDIALDEQSIRYYEYSDGIIAGCGLIEEGMKIGINHGIVKFGGRIYKLSGKALLPYEPTDTWTILKLRFGPRIQHKEYEHYAAELVLDGDVEIKPNEMEMGRFKLKKGSRLRTQYKDFWDMATEYDTVNLIEVRQSGKNGDTLSPVITTHFAREAFPYLRDNSLDSSFCTTCLSTGEAISRELITRYVCNRLSRDYERKSNVELHRALAEVLNRISGKSSGDIQSRRGDGVLVIN